MSTPQLQRLHAHCHRLRLSRVAAERTTLLEQAAKREVGYADFLDDLLAGVHRIHRLGEHRSFGRVPYPQAR
jgi:hypothetical protein